MKVRSDSWDEVVQKWINTFEYRQQFKSVETIAEYIENWPILNDLHSTNLVSSLKISNKNDQSKMFLFVLDKY